MLVNERMVAERPDLVLESHPAIDQSQGSKHLRNLCVATGIEVRVFER